LLIPMLATASELTSYTERTFFGVIKISETSDKRILSHGTTVHGEQYLDTPRRLQATSYYHEKGPLGDIILLCRKLTGCHRIGVVGLGAGTVAAYGTEGDQIRFFEIDPEVVRVAQNPQYFTYISDSKANISIAIGDGRLALRELDQRFDLLVIDAFTSDAIPVHLLTVEALDQYSSLLANDGLIALHT